MSVSRFMKCVAVGNGIVFYTSNTVTASTELESDNKKTSDKLDIKALLEILLKQKEDDETPQNSVLIELDKENAHSWCI